jgi:LmbE family N-acetylglucosaminyl deacetylase
MKAMALVAHPDDCVIFAYSFIHNHPEYSWTVCYLTYTETHSRSQEFIEFWNRRGIATKFLGYPDEWNHKDNCPGTIDEDSARLSVEKITATQDLLLTHNQQGEYGHPHHLLLNRVTANHSRRITFAGPGQGTVKYFVEPEAYSLEELPMHRNMIQNFHPTVHTNEYTL